jgi:ribosomal peptide maturation radical SAM protein 1
MPWMAANLPSIQLATLSAVLATEGIEADCHELYVDYAACIGWPLYGVLSNGTGFVEEWIFAQEYFREECSLDLGGFRLHRPRLGLGSRAVEERTLDALVPVTHAFLARMATAIDWSAYDVVGFSLTIAQTAASMALARLIKRRHPQVTIIFGGTSCAGPMGPALARTCPYIDVVVGVEGEPVLPGLIRAIRAGRPLSDIPGIAWRDRDCSVVVNGGKPVYRNIGDRPTLRYDAYFRKLRALGLDDQLSDLNIWIPFETSRGCWYGEKVQCTFCGLHEIMQFRQRSWESVLAELEELADSHGVTRFFAVDLIMPREHVRTLFPEITRRQHRWSLFYEIKATISRSDLELLSRAGVRWVQPGIESLDDDALKAMRKGVSTLINVQLLKWCAEMGIHVSWNIIVGIPGENAAGYEEMAERMRLLFHLIPPSGARAFELHRFSPYFEQPAAFGIEPLGAHRIYEHVFPVDENTRNDLAYLHEYRSSDRAFDNGRATAKALKPVLREWKRAHGDGARLDLVLGDDGTSEIRDTRTGALRTFTLDCDQTAFYRHLDVACRRDQVAASFARAEPAAAAALGAGGSEATLLEWERDGLVLTYRDRVVSLAVLVSSRTAGADDTEPALSAPLPYLA